MNYKTLLFTSIFITLGACGGGGGSSGSGGNNGGNVTPAPSVSINNANSSQVASTAGSGDSVAKSSSGGYAPLTANQAALNALTVRKLADMFYHLGSGQNLQPLGTSSCTNGGTVTSSEGLTGATSGTVTIHNCLLLDTIFDGTITKTVYSGDTDTDNFDATFEFTDFKVTFNTSAGPDTTTLNSVMRITSTSDGSLLTVDVNLQTFHVAHGADYVALYDFTLHSEVTISTQDYTLAFSYTFDSNLINGAVKVETVEPLVGNANLQFPYMGSVVITGANNSHVRVSTNGNGLATDLVTIDVDANGDSIYESSSTTTWSAFNATSLLQ